MSNLVKVVDVIEDNCVNCHQCIAVCPVKFCNAGSGSFVKINSNMCIGCGNCIKACTHEARIGKDDFDSFLELVKKGEKMVAVVAPAIAANFPNLYLNINGWLKSLGVEAIFDVSFGAELTVKSYVEHIKANSPKTVIAQPCPAIVTYIETYQPELIKYLAPADSPMLHTIKMVKKYYPQYSNYKVAVISPCFAKKREFDETGFGDFNVTYKSINDYFIKNKINLASFPALEYSNQPAERAVLFSTPGGLMRTAERDVPGISEKIRKIEGVHTVYEYFHKFPESIEKGYAPIILDCLNCEKGCNGGPATMNAEKSFDEIEYLIEQRADFMKRKYKDNDSIDLNKNLNDYWDEGVYDRAYVNNSSNNNIKLPSEYDVKAIYDLMLKKEAKDELNCAACGYNTCKDMAVAIHNGLNKPENCHHFKEAVIKDLNNTIKFDLDVNLLNLQTSTDDQKQSVVAMAGAIRRYLTTLNDLRNIIDTQNAHIDTNATAMTQLSAGVDHIFQNAENVSDQANENMIIAKQGKDRVEKVLGKVIEFNSSMININTYVDGIREMTERITNMLDVIVQIANQTNLLSINAAIEAARAGKHGKGFSIVANEVKSLSVQTSNLTNEISDVISRIKTTVNQTNEAVYSGLSLSEISKKLAGDASKSLNDIIDSIVAITGSTNLITINASEQRNASVEASESAHKLKELSDSTQETVDNQSDAIRDIIESFKVVRKVTGENATIADNLILIAEKLHEGMHTVD